MSTRTHDGAAPPRSRRRRLPGRLGRLPVWRTLLVVVVVALVVVGLLNAVHRGGGANTSSASHSAAKDKRTLLGALTGLDPAVVADVGAGGLASPFAAVKDAPALLGAGRRPQVVFLSTEGCGLCAAQRWSMIVALGRFGTLKDLPLAISSIKDPVGPLATFSFSNLAYTSKYVDVVAVETADANGRPLATLSPADQRVVDTYDAPPYVPASAAGGVPWLDIANRYVASGSGYPAKTITNLNWSQIAEKLGDARDPVAMAVVGNANWITAAICRVTGMSPSSVCDASAVQDLAKRLG